MRSWPLLLLFCDCQNPSRADPARYELPAGFTGAVLVEYQVPGASGLARDGTRRVLPVPATGYLATSEKQTFGVVDDVVERLDPTGKRWRLTAVACTGPIHQLGPPEYCRVSTGHTRKDGVTRYFEHLEVGPGTVTFETPELPQAP